MSAGERERRVVVVESRRRPRGGIVANLALLRESDGNMVRIVGCLELRQMAGDARCISQVVVAIGVTLAALQVRMSAR